MVYYTGKFFQDFFIILFLMAGIFFVLSKYNMIAW